MQATKEYKKGQLLFKEGDAVESIYFIQTGKVSIFLERQGKKIQIDELKSSQVLGEGGLFALGKHPFSAEAMVNSQVLEIPIKALNAQVEALPSTAKLILKSLHEDVKQLRSKIKSIALENDNSPCSQHHVPTLFFQYVLLSKHLGKANEAGEYKVSWSSLRHFSTRVFRESQQRLMSGLELLKKLGYCDWTKQYNEEEKIEEINEITFKDIATIDRFAEFYTYHIFKAGKPEAILVDDMAFKVIKILVQLSIGQKPNHQGNVVLEYDQVLKMAKEKTRIDLKNTHFDLLEKKGLMVQRKSTDKGLQLLFNGDDFMATAINWAIIKEIDMWNQKGFIDFNHVEDAAAAGQKETCPQCSQATQAEQKFCAHCGAKLAA